MPETRKPGKRKKAERSNSATPGQVCPTWNESAIPAFAVVIWLGGMDNLSLISSLSERLSDA